MGLLRFHVTRPTLKKSEGGPPTAFVPCMTQLGQTSFHVKLRNVMRVTQGCRRSVPRGTAVHLRPAFRAKYTRWQGRACFTWNRNLATLPVQKSGCRQLVQNETVNVLFTRNNLQVCKTFAKFSPWGNIWQESSLVQTKRAVSAKPPLPLIWPLVWPPQNNLPFSLIAIRKEMLLRLLVLLKIRHAGHFITR